MNRLKKIAFHDLYQRDCAMIYLDGQFIKNETHADCLNQYFKDNNLNFVNGEEAISGRADVDYEIDLNKNINKLPFACMSVVNNNIFIEEDTLKGITLNDLANKVKQQFPESTVYKESDECGDYGYNDDYHDEDLTPYKRIAKLNKDAVFCREPEDRDYDDDGAIIIINDKIYNGITHGNILNALNINESDINNIAYAHKDSKNNSIYLETDSLENISVDDSIKILKSKYSSYDIYDNDTEEKLATIKCNRLIKQ